MNTIHRIGALLLLAVAIFAGGCATDQAVIAQAADMNKQLEPAIMEHPLLSQYLQQLGERIIASAKVLSQQGVGPKSHKSSDSAWMFTENMKFHFVNSKTVNAFTTGGEHMYIYNALFQMVNSEDELAAVMAHEFAHVYARHVGKGMDRQYGMLAAMAAAGLAGYAVGGKEHGGEYAAIGAGVGGGVAQFVNMGFTRDDETEADKLGFAFYTRAGWDPKQFGNFFQKMVDAGYDKTPEMLSDHPTLKSRVEDAKRRTRELPANAKEWRKPPVADKAKFAQLQARAKELGAKLPDDKTLAGQELLRALPRSCVVPYVTKDEVEARQRIAKRAEAAEPKKQ